MAPLGRSQNLREMSIYCPYHWLRHNLIMIQNVFLFCFLGPFVFEDYVKDVGCSLYPNAHRYTSVSNIKLCVSRGV